jgi:hypothetical protein
MLLAKLMHGTVIYIIIILYHLTKYQKGVYYARIRVFNHLPVSIKNLANETSVQKDLKEVSYG